MPTVKSKESEYEGYISEFLIGGKRYKLRCEVVEVYPMICPKCGGQLELKYGHGKCEYCGTAFSTQFKVVEE